LTFPWQNTILAFYLTTHFNRPSGTDRTWPILPDHTALSPRELILDGAADYQPTKSFCF
jgi:hypothetical protein